MAADIAVLDGSGGDMALLCLVS
uniref:Uncharacterized protein n=1 Tax=Arundo donax TaxID=35708 RepID=A0A0A8Z5A1_ARUDO